MRSTLASILLFPVALAVFAAVASFSLVSGLSKRFLGVDLWPAETSPPEYTND